MGNSILSEVDDTSILRTEPSTCYWRLLDWLPTSRLLPPRSGLERSDFVRWPDSEVAERPGDFRFLRYSGLVVLTASLSESDPKRKSPSSPNERGTHSP